MLGAGGLGGLITRLAGGPVPPARPLPRPFPLLNPLFVPITRELMFGLCVAAENTDEPRVPAGDADLDDTRDGDLSRNDVVDDSLSLDGIFVLLLVVDDA